MGYEELRKDDVIMTVSQGSQRRRCVAGVPARSCQIPVTSASFAAVFASDTGAKLRLP
jgi:hypothetical protein